jgi:hypothetical protein
LERQNFKKPFCLNAFSLTFLLVLPKSKHQSKEEKHIGVISKRKNIELKKLKKRDIKDSK